MSMTGAIQARQSLNPYASAQQFNQQEQEAELERRPDTMSGQFFPAINVQGEPISALEQGAINTLDRVALESTELVNQTSALARAKQAEQERIRKQNAADTNASVQGEVGNAYQTDGTLSDARQQVLNKTASYAGTPYQLGGRTVKGIDCSGLVMSVYNQLGFNIQSHSVSGQAATIPGVRTTTNNLRPGDLVVWNDNSHIAVYAGNGMIWDASSSKGTTMRPLWSDKTYGVALRLPGE